MVRINKISENKYHKEEFGDFRFVPLTGKQGWKD
jgi:hypothetical protein